MHYMQVDLLGFYRIATRSGASRSAYNAAHERQHRFRRLRRQGLLRHQPAQGRVRHQGQAGTGIRPATARPAPWRSGPHRPSSSTSWPPRSARSESAGVLLNPFKLHNLLNAVGSSLLTDPSLNLIKMGREFADMSGGNITYKTIPNNGPQTICPDGVEGIDRRSDLRRLHPRLHPTPARQLSGRSSAGEPPRPATPSSVTVDVLNGTDTALLATHNAAQLRTLGFHTNTVDSTNATSATTVQYPPGSEAAAKAVGNAVHGATLVETSSVSRVTLITGSNGAAGERFGRIRHPQRAPRPAHLRRPQPPGLPCSHTKKAAAASYRIAGLHQLRSAGASRTEHPLSAGPTHSRCAGNLTGCPAGTRSEPSGWRARSCRALPPELDAR